MGRGGVEGSTMDWGFDRMAPRVGMSRCGALVEARVVEESGRGGLVGC